MAAIKSMAGIDLTEKVKDLLRLAREQGHLTYEDLNGALPENIATPEDLVGDAVLELESALKDLARVQKLLGDGGGK